MTTKKKPNLPDAPRNVIKVAQRFDGDDFEAATSWHLTRPEVQAAATIQAFQGENLEVNALVEQLSLQVAAANAGHLSRAEGMLIAQAHTLDEIFNHLARRSHTNMTAGYGDAAERYLRLALKAQTQCRATIETLATVKNPPVLFAKQANINNGGQQQVNNGAHLDADRSARGRAHAEDVRSEQSKLLGVRSGQIE